MTSRIFTVGIQLPGEAGEYVPFKSNQSLYDADVVLFCPHFDDYYSDDSYAGQRLISDSDSPALLRDIAHWRSEIKAAVESGKVVFVYLRLPSEVYYDTGARTHSGTGRSRVTTRHVDKKNSYDSMPLALKALMPRGGREISVLADLGPLAGYWHEFAAVSAYEVYFDHGTGQALLGTKNREKVVGTLVRTKGGGAIVLLPPVTWDEDSLTYTKGENVYWRKEGVALGSRLVAALAAASNALRKSGKRSPPPEWVLAPEYSLKPEESLKAAIAKTDEQMNELAGRRKTLEAHLEDARVLYGLLFESGTPLEQAVIRALKLLNFEASGYEVGESEFDAVFSSPEGRFLGEAEGKESKAVNIDKMSQLERNLQEDFARDEIESYAKGVLFGNAFRFTALADRSDFFTAKCRSAAARLGVALVRTPDLFPIAKYLIEHDDPDYAMQCRRALFDTEGAVVIFPPVPGIQQDGA